MKKVVLVLTLLVLALVLWSRNCSGNNVQPIPYPCAGDCSVYFKNADHASWDCAQGYKSDPAVPLACKKIK
jgi:hypothetical protein